MIQEKEEKEEQERIKQFQERWDIIREERIKQRAARCQSLLNTPLKFLSPEEKAERKKLLDRIAKQVKVVLRKADDAKIPMELAEANDIATEDIVNAEKEDEKQQCKVLYV